MSYLAAVMLFSLLGVAYVKGYDLVKSRSPEHLVHFYLIMATIRMLPAGTLAAVCVIFSANREDAIRFAAIFMMMYAVTMVIILKLRH